MTTHHRMIAAALCLAGMAAAIPPAEAMPLNVTYWVDFYFNVPTDGPNLPTKVIRREMRANSVAAVEGTCAHNLLKLSLYLQARDPSLQHYLSAGGGKCVTDSSGKIKMAVDTSVAGSK